MHIWSVGTAGFEAITVRRGGRESKRERRGRRKDEGQPAKMKGMAFRVVGREKQQARAG
jgi:hypothetical protein